MEVDSKSVHFLHHTMEAGAASEGTEKVISKLLLFPFPIPFTILLIHLFFEYIDSSGASQVSHGEKNGRKGKGRQAVISGRNRQEEHW